MSTDDFDYQCEASDESSEGDFMERSLSVWNSFTCYENGNDFVPVALDLHTACSIGHCDCVRQIIQKGGEDLNRKNRGGWTALMYACYIGHDTVVNLLLAAGVSVNTYNNKGHTPLMLSASCGNETVAYSLIQKGVEIESRDLRGWTALFHATYSGHQNMVRFLIDNRADINAVEPESELTPLMEAATAGHEIIVQYFLQHGVNVKAKSRAGETARSRAFANGHTKIVLLLDNYVQRSDSGSGSSSDEGQSGDGIRKRAKQTIPKDANIRAGPDKFDALLAQQLTSGPRVPVDSLDNGYNNYEDTGAVTMKMTSPLLTNVSPVSCEQTSTKVTRVTPSELLPPGMAQRPASDIAVLLQELDLTKYLTVFEEQDIDLQVFLTLTDSDLKQIGIDKFGPRKKMTNAIARWHSNAPPSGNKLEQAYADKLETEMQEMAIRLHQACEQLEHVKLQLRQEHELRSVTEACLMEDRTLWTHVTNMSADTLQKCAGMRVMLNTVSECCEELARRCSVDTRLSDSGNRNTMVAALIQGLALGGGGPPDGGVLGVSSLSTPHLVQRLLCTRDLLQQTLSCVYNNSDKLVKRQYNTAAIHR